MKELLKYILVKKRTFNRCNVHILKQYDKEGGRSPVGKLD